MSYGSLLDAFSRAQQLPAAKETLRAMRSAGLRVSALSFNLVLKACGAAVSEARRLLTEAESFQVEVDVYSLNSVLRLGRRHGRIE